jgi:hypothetical protein
MTQLNLSEVYDRINANRYVGNEDAFRTDALEACGLTNNPKAGEAFRLACEFSNGSGYGDILNILDDLATLLK